LKKSIYSDKQRKLCDLVIKAREKAGLTQIQVAKKLGRPQSFVAKYEGGERRLDVIELLEISKIIGTDIKTILDKLS
jgi:transcriptional regulator with XRE-family HTH domain